MSGPSATRAELASEKGVRRCLERIEERERDVAAWEFLDPALPLAEARARDAEQPRSPLHGLAIGVKDLIDTAEMPTAYGSPIHAGRRPGADAACIARLRAAGAVVLGKTTTTEFATYHPSKTRNPHDPRRTPGGSSSGSAAAVAAGMVPLALGTQTAGSIIRPASFCGVFGLKPSYGAIGRDGVFMLSDRLDTVGCFAAEADGLAQLLAIMADPGRQLDLVPRAPVEHPRIGLYRSEHWREADPDGRRAVEEAADRLSAAGAHLSEVSLPDSFAGLVEAQQTIMAVDVARALSDEYASHRDQLSVELAGLIEEGHSAGEQAYRTGIELADRCAGRLGTAMAGLDALLTPGVKGEAPLGLHATGDPLFCRSWTLLGVPAVSVPGMTGGDGMPIGVQLIGAGGQDASLIAVARWAAAALA